MSGNANYSNCDLSRIVAQKDITNVLLTTTLIGSTLYLYGRPHLREVPTKNRALYR